MEHIGHISTPTKKKKKQKEKIRCGGDEGAALRAAGGQGGAKERRLKPP